MVGTGCTYGARRWEDCWMGTARRWWDSGIVAFWHRVTVAFVALWHCGFATLPHSALRQWIKLKRKTFCVSSFHCMLLVWLLLSCPPWHLGSCCGCPYSKFISGWCKIVFSPLVVSYSIHIQIWYQKLLALRHCSIVVLWHSDTAELRDYGIVALQHCDNFAALRHWHCGSATLPHPVLRQCIIQLSVQVHTKAFSVYLLPQ